MAAKDAKDIQVYTDKGWKTLKDQQVYTDSGWKPFKDGSGVCCDGDWYVLKTIETPPQLKENKVKLYLIKDDGKSETYLGFRAVASSEVNSDLKIDYSVIFRENNGGKESKFNFSITIIKGEKEGFIGTSKLYFDSSRRFYSAKITPSSDEVYNYIVNNNQYELLVT